MNAAVHRVRVASNGGFVQSLKPRSSDDSWADTAQRPNQSVPRSGGAVRFSLRAGQTFAVHTRGSYVLVPLAPGRLANVCGTTEARSVEIAGFL
jgi:hypothetical protein